MARFEHSVRHPIARHAGRGALVALLLTGLATPAAAGGGRAIKETTKNAVITGGRAARDGVLTFGRSTRDFFTKGPSAAKETWKQNAARTKANARSGGRATRRAAKSS